MQLKQKTSADLSRISETDLITELWNRGIDIDHITGAYVWLDEINTHKWDEMTGYSENGLHGRDSDKPKANK